MKKIIGRFAPSPSGPLHFGSLITALASYFQAKSQQGEWLVRIEDIDPPREIIGSDTLILTALERYGLLWDNEILYQSTRHHAYQEAIELFLKNDLAYYCTCTRKQIKEQGGYYLGHCRSLKRQTDHSTAIRLIVDEPVFDFHDQRLGKLSIPKQLASEDFIIQRRDGLIAYNLAVVVDDIYQGVTEVVRGADLIEPTGRQINLYQALNQPVASYLHIPLIVDDQGNKLSKQNHAPAIDIHTPQPTLIKAMELLGFKETKMLAGCSVSDIIQFGIQQWQFKQLETNLHMAQKVPQNKI